MIANNVTAADAAAGGADAAAASIEAEIARIEAELAAAAAAVEGKKKMMPLMNNNNNNNTSNNSSSNSPSSSSPKNANLVKTKDSQIEYVADEFHSQVKPKMMTTSTTIKKRDAPSIVSAASSAKELEEEIERMQRDIEAAKKGTHHLNHQNHHHHHHTTSKKHSSAASVVSNASSRRSSTSRGTRGSRSNTRRSSTTTKADNAASSAAAALKLKKEIEQMEHDINNMSTQSMHSDDGITSDCESATSHTTRTDATPLMSNRGLGGSSRPQQLPSSLLLYPTTIQTITEVDEATKLEQEIKAMEAALKTKKTNTTTTTTNNNTNTSDSGSNLQTAEEIEEEIRRMQAEIEGKTYTPSPSRTTATVAAPAVVTPVSEKETTTPRSTNPLLAGIQAAGAKRAAAANANANAPSSSEISSMGAETKSPPTTKTALATNPLLAGIQAAAAAKNNNGDHDVITTMGTATPKQQSKFTITSESGSNNHDNHNHNNDTFQRPPHPLFGGPANPLLGAIEAAATSRNERLEETGGELVMKEYTPEIAEPQQTTTPQLSFSMAEMVSKAARARDTRLAEGGKKKMTKLKPKEELKKDFTNIAIDAANLGRLTRLEEHTVEAVATEKTPEQEWKSQGVLAHHWRSNFMSIIHEAANLGAETKMPEHVVKNYDDKEDDELLYEEFTKDETRSPRMKQLLELDGIVGKGQLKVDKLVQGRKEESAGGDSLLVRPMQFYNSIDDVQLPRQRPPRIDPAKAKAKWEQQRLSASSDSDSRPMTDIGHSVAEIAWQRRMRLDRPGNLPKVQEKCPCPYCVNPSPYQTFAYRELEKRLKASGEWDICNPLQMDDPRVLELADQKAAHVAGYEPSSSSTTTIKKKNNPVQTFVPLPTPEPAPAEPVPTQVNETKTSTNKVKRIPTATPPPKEVGCQCVIL